MNYTHEQYACMRETIVSALMEAELHNSRVMKRLTSESDLYDMHEKLGEVLRRGIEQCGKIEEAYG